MQQQHHDAQQDSEIDRLWSRVHNHADVLQQHEIKLATMGSDIETLKGSIELMRLTTASSAQLDGHVKLLTLQLQHLQEDLVQIKKLLYGGVAMILSAVLLASLSLVLK